MACIVSTIRRISTPKFGYENPICPRASIHQSVSLILAFRVNGPSVRESGVVSKMLMLSGSASAYFVLPCRISEDPCLMLSLIHISEPTRPSHISRMPSSASKNFFFNDTATTEIYTIVASSAASDVYKRQM